MKGFNIDKSQVEHSRIGLWCFNKMIRFFEKRLQYIWLCDQCNFSVQANNAAGLEDGRQGHLRRCH